MIRWIVFDEGENGIYKRKRDAAKEYDRLIAMSKYPFKDTLEILRHDTKTDTYTEVTIK